MIFNGTLILLVLYLNFFTILSPALLNPVNPQDQPPSPYDLIAAVNALRTNRGLRPYNVDPLLMLSAQTQADYVASQYPNLVSGHVGPGGTNADARAKAVGFPDVPGLDILENWASMPLGMSFEEIFSTVWSDSLHQETMLHPRGQLVGAGVALAGDNVIYILDVAAYFGDIGLTPQPTTAINSLGIVVSQYIAPVVIATPNIDGSVVHIVQSGQSLWSIATTYGVSIQSIKELNNIRAMDTIFIGQKLIIHPTGFITPTLPAITATPSYQDLQLPVGTPSPNLNVPTPTSTHSNKNLSIDQNNFFLVLMIVLGVGLILVVIGLRHSVG